MKMTRDELVGAVLEELLAEKDPPEKALEIAERIADRFRLDAEPLAIVSPDIAPAVKTYDLRLEQDYKYPGGRPKVRIRGGKVVQRDPVKVTGIVIHQTAVEFGLSKHQVRASNGDRELALARRALDVACHVFASRSGFIVLTHRLRDRVNHGNGFNGYSLGLEIDGRYSGLEDDPETVAREDLRTTWRGNPTELTSRTVRAARAAIKHMVEEGRAQGMPIEHIWAHRQSSGQRRSDPGETIWQRVVLEYAVAELGLKTHPETVLVSPSAGSGRTIPLLWDQDGVGVY